jgi:hypothetical protein
MIDLKPYQNPDDGIQEFLKQYCEVGTNYTEHSGELYRQYHDFVWNMTPWNVVQPGTFVKYLISHGFHKHRKNTGSYFYGIRLKQNNRRQKI